MCTEDRNAQVSEVWESIESDMDFLAVTGVEDKLQDDVKKTIETFRQAGIQVWMLTGDKVETARCIAIATGMTKNDEEVFIITGDLGESLIKDKIRAYEGKNSLLIMVDGSALTIIMSRPELMRDFFKVTEHSKSVCVCRCSPSQKALVAKHIRILTGKRIACVGDGGNDVPMILEADVGLGIVGKEGQQASLASDFSLQQFSHLKDLIIWHGRISYQRSAMLT